MSAGLDQELVKFIEKYIELLEAQLTSVRAVMAKTVSEVMSGIETISKTTTKTRERASEIISQTYLAPDRATIKVMQDIQSSVDSVVENAKQDSTSSPATPMKSIPISPSTQDLLRRHGGHFSKHMEALTSLDDELKNLLLQMMGALSNDDVIGQRLEHVVQALHAMKVGLSYMLFDFPGRYNPAGVQQFKTDLMNSTLKQYTTEEERDLFNATLGKLAAPTKKAS